VPQVLHIAWQHEARGVFVTQIDSLGINEATFLLPADDWSTGSDD
jgi:hypothetical protein